MTDDLEIMVVDITEIGLKNDVPTRNDFLESGKKLNEAFKHIGFVYLENHGVDSELVTQAMSISKDFFLQSEEEKEKITRINQQGWVAQGREIFDQAEDGSIAQMEVREAFDVNLLDSEARFPDETHPEFRTSIVTLANQSINLSYRILKALSLHFGKDDDFFAKQHRRILKGDNASALRSLYYPPILGELKPGYIRCGEHSDYGTFTLLYQDQYPGLQVKSAAGSWVDAVPIPQTILVNIGDLLEMWTAGEYPATKHRVLIPDEELTKTTARQSIVLFVHPDDEVVVAPLTSADPRFPPVTALEHVTKRFSQTYKY